VGTPVLIVSPDPAFAELLRLTLEEHSQRPSLRALSGQEAIAKAKETAFALAILDADTADMTLAEMGIALRRIQPALPLVLISAEEPEPEAQALNPVACLSKPFYLPDLEALFERLLSKEETGTSATPQEKPSSATEPPPPWLTDVSLAAQHLTRLSLESAAQAALITRGNRMWAYAGQLPQPAAEELARHVVELWARDGSDRTDLARFLRLRSTDSEYMLYITPLAGDLVLALAFDVGTPFSQIRMQAGRLARSLSAPPTEETVSASSPQADEATEPDPEQTVPKDDLLLNDDWDPMSENDLTDVPPLFEEVPPPIPADWLPEVGEAAQAEFLNALSSQSSKPVTTQVTDQADVPSNHAPQATPEPSHGADSVHQAETQPSKVTPKPIFQAQPASPSQYALKYNALLIPRFPNHHLVGDLARKLNQWLRQLCLAYGWRLEGVQIRPEYLLLTVDVLPNTAPGHLVRILRRHTSGFIFSHFPRLAEDNPSGEFWAPGYLITSGSTPPPPSLIRDFIQHIRQRQGIRS